MAILAWADEKWAAAVLLNPLCIIQDPVLSSSPMPKLNNLKWDLSLSLCHAQSLADANETQTHRASSLCPHECVETGTNLTKHVRKKRIQMPRYVNDMYDASPLDTHTNTNQNTRKYVPIVINKLYNNSSHLSLSFDLCKSKKKSASLKNPTRVELVHYFIN